ncbi:MAG: hypothetical protein KDJ80_13785 [Nitratireductor sp.]|nr:hypothetical protein [Nitratireductor sp.]
MRFQIAGSPMHDKLKALTRLLKVLNAAGCGGAEYRIGKEGVVIMRGGREHRFGCQTYDEAIRRGLVDPADRLNLTAEGRAALTRLLDPESGFQAQNRQLAVRTAQQDGGTRAVLANHAESPLERLHSRKAGNGEPWIDATEFQAGEKLRRDFELAGLQPRISANWVASVASRNRSPGGSAEITDFALDAKRRFEAAHMAIGPELAGVVVDVCCFLKGLETVERERKWPPRSAKLMLRTALRILVRHYGLTPPGGRRAMRQWGGEGYRPEAAFPGTPG